MLTLSPSATQAVTTIIGNQSEAPTAGLRIGGAAPEYTVSVVPTPSDEDILVEQDGARVYLSGAAALALDDKMLEARVDDGGALTFSLAAQA